MGSIRHLRAAVSTVTAPCGGDDCQRELDAVRERLKGAVRLLAEFHDRARVLWGNETKYTDSDLWARTRKALVE